MLLNIVKTCKKIVKTPSKRVLSQEKEVKTCREGVLGSSLGIICRRWGSRSCIRLFGVRSSWELLF